jgi:manganese transport protein
LSVILPVPMISLLLLSRRKSVMGDYATSSTAFVFAVAATAIVLVLNAILIAQTAGVPMPGLGA